MTEPQATFSVTYLADHPSFAPILATWTHQQWGRLSPHVTYEMRLAEFEKMAVRQTIPLTFVAIGDDSPVGMASIVKHDMRTQMELTPWLAAVYVAPAYRNRGIGSLVVRRAMQEAAALGFGRLYLFTPDRAHFYRRLGWREVERVSYREEQVTIMSYNFPTQPHQEDTP